MVYKIDNNLGSGNTTNTKMFASPLKSTSGNPPSSQLSGGFFKDDPPFGRSLNAAVPQFQSSAKSTLGNRSPGNRRSKFSNSGVTTKTPPPPRAPDKVRKRKNDALRKKVRERMRTVGIKYVDFFERDGNCGSDLTGMYSYDGEEWFFFKYARRTEIIKSHIRATDEACDLASNNKPLRDLLAKYNALIIAIKSDETEKLQNVFGEVILVCDYVKLEPISDNETKVHFNEIADLLEKYNIYCDRDPGHGEQNYAALSDSPKWAIFDLLFGKPVDEFYDSL